MTALFDEPPIAISPTLARAFGLPAAVFLQQLHYWTGEKAKNPAKYKDSHVNGYFWVYNSVGTWLKEMPFLGSVPTFKRLLAELQSKGVLVIEHHNKLKQDRTSWYRINYLRLNQILEQQVIQPSYQNDTANVSKRYDATYQNDPTITRDYTETTTETTEDNISARELVQIPINVTIEKQELLPTIVKPKPLVGFETFWQSYPKKVAKPEAERAWAKLKPDPATQQAIVKATEERRAGDPQWTEQRFIPNPSTYLNQRRWEDEWRPPQGAVSKPAPSRQQQNQNYLADRLRAVMAEEETEKQRSLASG